MPLDFPGYETIRAMVQAIWQSERPNADATRYSDLWLFSRVLARMVHRLHWTVDRAVAALHPQTTWGDYLDAWLWFAGLSNGDGGYGRIEARGSSTTDGVTVTATGATVDLQGYQLTDDAGRVYEIAESYSFGGAGSANLDLDAISTGLATNLEDGDDLTFSSPPANVNAAAVVYTDLTGGADRETDAEGRQRLVARFQNPPASGNAADWVDAIQSASPGELDVYVWPWRWNQPTGWGTTDYCALQRGASRAARHIGSGDALYAAITAAVLADMPAEHYYYSRQLTLTNSETDINLVIELADYASSSQKCDWDAYGTAGAHKPAVSAVADPQVTATKNITGYGDDRDIQVGDKVIIGGAQAVVDSVGVGGNTKFTVSTWFDEYDADLNPHPWPAGYDPTVLSGHLNYICSGGGIIMDIIDALFELADGLGPARGSYASTSLAWDDTLRLQSIKTAVINAGNGVAIDSTITLPATDIAPTAGSGATTERVVVYDFAVFEEK